MKGTGCYLCVDDLVVLLLIEMRKFITQGIMLYFLFWLQFFGIDFYIYRRLVEASHSTVVIPVY
jgi:hypothetical protein